MSLRDVLSRNVRGVARQARDLVTGRQMVEGDRVEDFWALQDIDFEIKRGEVVGVIGRNGAGKSTLLKVLSRITEPTTGRVEIRGRVASLLEVGTGFHPELTGRQNIFLNGSILGMSRTEIQRRFDEIVAFSEVETFLDTPVKRYSSGMYVRLAFAVAAHLEPEILVVDEVLAVGDAEFQRKCLGKMQDVAAQGRTVLFVSHQLGMISRLCSRAMVLTGGKLTFSGTSDAAIDAYVSDRPSAMSHSLDLGPRPSHLPAFITDFQVVGSDGSPAGEFPWRDCIRLQIQVAQTRQVAGLVLGVAIDNRHSTRVTTWVSRLADIMSVNDPDTEIQLEIPGEIIAPGTYSFTLALFEPGGDVHQLVENVWPINIVESGSIMSEFSNIDYGVTIIPAKWSSESRNANKMPEPQGEQ